MILVDTALAAREADDRPLRVGFVGAGFMGHGLANQITNSVPGMRVAAIANRHLDRAVDAYRYAGLEEILSADTLSSLEDSIRDRRPVVIEDAMVLAQSEQIDVLVDLTGSVEFGAHVVLEAFRHGQHVVLMNAEIDATIGPLLHVEARKHGVTMSACDGDEPGIQMNLFRWVRGLGLIPRVMGNVKGLQDRYRNPETQAGFAARWGQNPYMVTSFADGSKLSFEQAIVANATGFRVLTRGMSRGTEFSGDPMELPTLYDLEGIRALGGIIDYTVGPRHVKVFCLAEHPDPKQQHYLELFHMGPGPLYTFWTPYHLVNMEVPNSIARVALFGDSLAPPLGGPVVEVCAVAKRDLKSGEVLDEYGGFATYGEAANSEEMSDGHYLPEGLVSGCAMLRDVAQDEVLRYEDVRLPPDRLADRLRAEQYRHFSGATWLHEHLEGAGTLSRA